MQKNAVKAATCKRANSESNLSWVPEKTDVILSKRETRSSKPEVVYRLSDASAVEPLVSPGAPSLESIVDLPGSPLQPLALEEVFHNTPPHSPQVNLLSPLPIFSSIFTVATGSSGNSRFASRNPCSNSAA